jgi:hypothetical protein
MPSTVYTLPNSYIPPKPLKRKADTKAFFQPSLGLSKDAAEPSSSRWGDQGKKKTASHAADCRDLATPKPAKSLNG